MLVHFEHSGLLASEYLLKLVIGQYLSLVLRILEVIRLYVGPDFLDHFAPRNLAVANNIGQLRRGRNRRGDPSARATGGLACFLYLCDSRYCLLFATLLTSLRHELLPCWSLAG